MKPNDQAGNGTLFIRNLNNQNQTIATEYHVFKRLRKITGYIKIGEQYVTFGNEHMIFLNNNIRISNITFYKKDVKSMYDTFSFKVFTQGLNRSNYGSMKMSDRLRARHVSETFK